MTNPMREVIARLQAQYSDDPRLKQKSFWDEISGIPGDILSGLGSVVGIEPSEDQIIRERKYPITTFLGSTLGFGGGYGAAWKVTKAIPKIDKAIKGLEFFGKAATSPVKAAVVDSAARTGLIEGGRLVANMVIPGGQPVEDMALEGLLNVGVGAAFGGIGGSLGQGGKRNAPLQEIFKDIDMNAPDQIQIRQLSKALTDGVIPDQHLTSARNRLAQLKDRVRTQRPPDGVSAVNATVGGGEKRLNRLFEERGKPISGLVRRRFARTEKDFPTDASWQAAAAQLGPVEDWLPFSQYPRHISFKSDKAAKRIQNTVYQTMQAAGDGWYVTQEMNDGLFVVAKKLKGAATKPGKDDAWFITKTDKPGTFRPAHAAWKDAVGDHMQFLAKPPKPRGPVNDIYDSARGMMETMPMRKFVGSGAATGSVAELGGKVGKMLGLEGVSQNSGEMTKRVKDFLVEHITPSVNQFGRAPRAGWIFGIARGTYDSAESIFRKIVYGEKSLDPGKSAFTHVLGKPVNPTGDSIKKVADALGDEDVRQVWQVIRNQTPLKDAEQLFAEGALSENSWKFLQTLDGIDKDISGQIMKVEAATGGGGFKPKEGHYMMSHKWEGDNRVAIRDAEDRLIGVAGGQSRVGAQREADKLLAKMEEEGLTGLRKAEEFDIAQTAQLPKDIRMQVFSPAWSMERQGVRGFKYDMQPFTKKELLEELAANVQRRTKYMADRSVQDLLADDIAKLAVEDPTMHRILVGRLNDLAGQRTPLAKIMDQTVDAMLGPVLGKNTASKIVATTNKLMWHLELGAMRLAYPVMNALTFVQTTMPEIAYVASAKPEHLAKYYDMFAGPAGGQIARGGVLSPIKMMWAGTRQMSSKDPVFIKAVEKGINEGVIDPRFIEEFTGAVGARAKWNEALKSSEGFGSWLGAVSEYMPAQTEKFSRLQSFSTGWILAKDLLGAVDDELAYRFAKQFTERTMFRYGMDARPRLFTTPAGSMLGLFKNWQMHYVGMMLDYTGEGVMRNNWSPLLWQTAGTAATGGMVALPLWTVANGFSEAMTGKSALVNGYEMFDPLGDQVSDGIFYGLPGLLGVSLSSSATAPFNNPMRDVTQFMSLVHWDRAQAAGKFFAGAMDTMQTTGQSPLEDANTRDMFFRAFAPKTMYRTMATVEDGVINSLSTGNPVLKDQGVMDRVLFSLGFNPVQIEKAYAVSSELWDDQNAMRAAVQKYGEAMAHAFEHDDQKLMETIAMRAVSEGVDLSSIERSAMSRLAKGESDVVNRQFKQEDIDERLVVMGDRYNAESR